MTLKAPMTFRDLVESITGRRKAFRDKVGMTEGKAQPMKTAATVPTDVVDGQSRPTKEFKSSKDVKAPAQKSKLKQPAPRLKGVPPGQKVNPGKTVKIPNKALGEDSLDELTNKPPAKARGKLAPFKKFARNKTTTGGAMVTK